MVDSMKAAVSARYGPPDVVEIRNVPKPVPQASEVLVKVRATTVNRTDSGMRGAHPFFIRAMIGLLRPKRTILGMEFAGVVETAGEEVTDFQPGQRVFGMSPEAYGGHAEFLLVPEDGPIAAMPADLDFDEAVLCEGAWYAQSCLQRLALGPGHKILIYGASGAIGTAAVQLAKAVGADVTAVVGTQHQDLATSLGADRVVDYTMEDFTRISDDVDFVFDAVGKTTFFRCRRMLRPQGIFATTDLGPFWQTPILVLWFSITRSKRVVLPLPIPAGSEFVHFLKDRMEAGELRAVIDRTYTLDAIVEAYRYVETGTKTGTVVLHPAPATDAGAPESSASSD